jgi:sulfate adenylyltransferase
MSDPFMSPYGGQIVNLLADEKRAADLKLQARDLPACHLDDRQARDLEMLSTGAFAPLTGFMGRDDAESVSTRMRLADGTLWPLPVVLSISPELAGGLENGGHLALYDPEGVPIAILHVDEVWQPDEALAASLRHLAVDRGATATGSHLASARPHVAGRVESIAEPTHWDFLPFRLSPARLRAEMAERGWKKLVALVARAPIHRAGIETSSRIAQEHGAGVLLFGLTQPPEMTDLRHYPAMRALTAAAAAYPDDMARLAILPLTGPPHSFRHAVLRAVVARNYGCSTLCIPPRETPEPCSDGPDVTIDVAAAEIGIEIRTLPDTCYVPYLDAHVPADEAPKGHEALTIDEEEILRRLRAGADLPTWFSYPTIVEQMRGLHPPMSKEGFTVFFTGLSGSGKSTVAKLLFARLLELGGRSVTLLDGDIVRKNLSSELGFTKEHRDINVRRIGFVAYEVTKAGGIAICAPIAPYDETRRDVRALVEATGGFVLVHVSTPIDVCESRDRKGLYAKARAGLIKEFTGVSDPFEVPTDAEVTLDTSRLSPAEAVDSVLSFLFAQGFIVAPGTQTGSA